MNRSFLISIYGLTALSGGMIAFAEEIPFPSGLTLPLAILAYFFNEREHRIRITTFWANILGVVAFVIAATELLVAGFSEAGFAAEGRLLAGAHLLSYLVWVALFQDKHGRQYWWLMALGVMQVAVGAILSHDPFFGIMLLFYVFLSLWTLSVFSLYQARYGFETAGQASATAALTAPSSQDRQPGSNLIFGQPDEVHGAIQLDPHEQWVNRRFVMGVVTTSLLSIFVGMIFFVLIPRLWVGKEYDFDDRATPGFRRVTGFTDEVQLGEIGQILESNESVLEVRFFTAYSMKSLDVEEVSRTLGYEEPLFRGSVMGSYNNGRWHVLDQSQDVTELLPPRHLNDQLIRQHYIVHDGSSKTLFGMHPVFATEFGDDELLRPAIDVVTSILFRRDEDKSKRSQLEYVLFAGTPRVSSNRPYIYAHRSGPAQQARQATMPELLKLPSGLDRLSQLSRQIAEAVSSFEASPDPPDVRIARRIEQHLQSSGGYKYSLSNEIVDPLIDPVEDFLFNRKQGHCEYSATAMALMLRAVDIPSRLVSGFKGGQLSGFSGAFVVEGRHAHAWVEAWVGGQWRTFDPTPLERAESVAEIGEERSIFSNLQGLLAGFWEQRIVRLSIDEQKSMIYAPLGDALKDMTTKASSPFGDAGRKFTEFFSDPRKWFSTETFIGTAVLMFLIIGFKILWRKYGPQDAGLIRWLIRQIRILVLRLFVSEDRIRVEFYERFLSILAKHGLTKRPSQTALEFAADVEDQLSTRLSPADLAQLPRDIATSFYRVRYGSKTLTIEELSSLSANLDQLKAAVASH
jgi:transglutaminase-like putative cysteine protease